MPEGRGLEPGDSVAPFSLPNAQLEGRLSNLEDMMGEGGLVIVFTCNHCPYVVGSESRIEAMASFARESGLGFIGINSNDPINYPSDNWSSMIKRATKMSYSYLHDAEQTVATMYGAERTPEFYLCDSDGIITYRGRLDDSPVDPSKVTTNELHDAILAQLAGETPNINRTDSIGCSVKWA